MRVLALVVEGDEAVGAAMQRLLSSASAEVSMAWDVASARASMTGERFDVVLTALELGAGSGLEVLRLAEQLQPSARRCLLTGAPDAQQRLHDEGLREVLVIDKPWNDEAVLRALGLRA